MTFFNKKTEVIDIELTPYGRYLLSIGKLKPKFYDFSDEDILYDIAATDSSAQEQQELAHDRITKETPRLKTLYLKQGVQEESENDFGQTGSVDFSINVIREQIQIESHNQNQIYSMGKSSYESDKSPAFQATMLRGEIADSLNYLSASFVVDSINIPQIEIDFILTATTENDFSDPADQYEFTSPVYADGSYTKLDFQNPVIHLKEFNSFYEKENFEVEVFLIREEVNYNFVDDGGSRYAKPKMEPLKFNRKISAIKNDLLVYDENEIDMMSPPPSIEFEEQDTPIDRVSHFFEVLVDDQIPIEELCQLVDKLEINNQFIDEELVCPDVRTDRFDIYATKVTPEDLEDCD